jgi:hypothetical protein
MQGIGLRRDSGQCLTAAQPFCSVLLIVRDDIEIEVQLGSGSLDDFWEPRGQAVAINGDPDHGRNALRRIVNRRQAFPQIVLEQMHLRDVSIQLLTVLGRNTRPTAHDECSSGFFFQELYPLAYGRLSDIQRAGRSLERALANDGGQRFQQGILKLHICSLFLISGSYGKCEASAQILQEI